MVLAIATPLSTRGRYIVDARGNRVKLAGVNWYGASEDMGVPVGLDCNDRNAIAEIIAQQGFNCVRFPFSLWMTEQTTPVADQYLLRNPDLHGSTPMQVYDACVKALTAQGLIVIPNVHLLDFGWCCANNDTNGLWFNDRWPAAKFTAVWQDIARRYASNPLVAAMDIKNEPRHATVGGATQAPAWGNAQETDFAAMYATVGNLLHQIDPDLLIICEGLNYAGDLTGVASHPVQLAKPGKVVYSMHDYSWSDHPAGQTQAAYIQQMTTNGGYLLNQGIAPVWVGEFGRTPVITRINAGREHHPWCYSAVLAGGGIRGGQAYGKSDRIAAYPAENPVSPADLAATVYHALGIAPETFLKDREGRHIKLTEGWSVRSLFG